MMRQPEVCGEWRAYLVGLPVPFLNLPFPSKTCLFLGHLNQKQVWAWESSEVLRRYHHRGGLMGYTSSPVGPEEPGPGGKVEATWRGGGLSCWVAVLLGLGQRKGRT